MKTNLSYFLNTIGDAVMDQAAHIEEAGGSEHENEALALRDYASQLWAVGDACDDDERIDWSRLVDKIGIDLIEDEENGDTDREKPQLLFDKLVSIS